MVPGTRGALGRPIVADDGALGGRSAEKQADNVAQVEHMREHLAQHGYLLQRYAPEQPGIILPPVLMEHLAEAERES